MNTMTLLWVLFAGTTVIALGLLLYRGLLTRYEEDQLFLNDNILDGEHQRQNDLVRRVNRVQPFITVIGGAACLLLVGIVSGYTWIAWQALNNPPR